MVTATGHGNGSRRGGQRLAVRGRSLAAGLAVALLLSACHSQERSRPIRPGPLRDPGAPATSIGFGVDPGRAFQYALVRLTNHGSGPATLSGIHLVHASPGLGLVGAYVMDSAASRGVLADSPRFAPAALALLPLRGATIAPAHGPQDSLLLVLGLRVVAPGDYGFRGIAIDYRVRGSAYRVTYPSWLRVCAPRRVRQRCPAQPLPRTPAP